MGAAQKVQVEDFDEVFGSISRLYDHAESIIKIAYSDIVEDREKFVEDIEGLVAQIEESANTIAEDFGNVIESNQAPTNAMKIRISSALRKVLLAIEDYKKLVNVE